MNDNKSNFMSQLLSGSENKGTRSVKRHHKNVNSNHVNNKKVNQHRVNKVRVSHPHHAKSTTNRYGMLPWSCTLNLKTVAQLEALKQIYHFRNRDQAVQLLIRKALKRAIKSSGQNGREDFDFMYKAFLFKTKPKAIAHFKKFYSSKKS